MATGFLVGMPVSAKGRGEDGYWWICVAVLGKRGGTARQGCEAKVVYAL